MKKGFFILFLLFSFTFILLLNFFASQLYDEVFKPSDQLNMVGGMNSHLVVTDVTDQTITIDIQSLGLSNIRSLGQYRLQSQTGFGIVSKIINQTEDSVTRAFHLVDGFISATQIVETDEELMPPKKMLTQLALSYPIKYIQFDTELGQNKGVIVGKPSRQWVIMIHGFKGSLIEGARINQWDTYLAKNWQVFSIGLRNDMDQPKDSSKRISWGLTERFDVEAAIAYAKVNGATDIVLHGVSFGGNVLLNYLALSENSKQVKGVVLDAASVSVKDNVALLSSVAYPFMPSFFQTLIFKATELKYGVTFDEFNALRYLSSIDTPALFIHSKTDNWCSFDLIKQVQARFTGPQQTFFVESGRHATEPNIDEQGYKLSIRHFLDGL